MSDGVQLMLNEDGKAEIYDDTWDIVIHCETEKDFNEAMEKILSMNWIPVTERLPESDPDELEYPTVLGSFADGSIEFVCYYESTKEWGGGEDFDMKRYPVAWMPLPEPYKEKE